MEDKIAKELIAQLKRIADALEKSNNLESIREKRKVTIDKLEEKSLRSELRDKMSNISENTDYRDIPTFNK